MGLDQTGFGDCWCCSKSSPQHQGPGQGEGLDDGPAHGVEQRLCLHLCVEVEEKREELGPLGWVLQG